MNGWDRLLESAAKPQRLALGLMSGMSRDGLDIALVAIGGHGDNPRTADLVGSTTVSYPAALRERLLRLPDVRVDELTALDFDLPNFWADETLSFLATLDVEPSAVDVLGSHGQTAFHRPRENGHSAHTLQIGQGDVLAERTGIVTVSDFRPRDVAAGGEGAPLIPLADFLLFARPDQSVACHNLGSIANVTVCPRTGSPNARAGIIAFDSGPANALIDAFARGCSDDGFDRDGTLSAQGSVNDDALLAMYTKRAKWLRQRPPKSAGFQTFGTELASELSNAMPNVTDLDWVRTAVEFTAQTLRDAYEWHVCPGQDELRVVHLSGGGCRNPTLMGRIEVLFDNLPLDVKPLDDTWIDAKEAVGFAMLADETLQGRAGNVPAATGAVGPRVLGKVSLA